MIISALLAVASNALLVSALRTSDLSVLGPINAYKSVISLLLALAILHEVPTPLGASGVALIVAGSYFVIDRPNNQTRRHAVLRFIRERGIRLRFAALGCSATEAVFLKRALLESTPLATFQMWCLLGLPIAAMATIILVGRNLHGQLKLLRHHSQYFLWLALTTGLMQYTTLYTLIHFQVGYSIALFQLSTLLSVLLGYRYFQERNLGRRLIGTVIMIVGATLITAFGSRH